MEFETFNFIDVGRLFMQLVYTKIIEEDGKLAVVYFDEYFIGLKITSNILL